MNMKIELYPRIALWCKSVRVDALGVPTGNENTFGTIGSLKKDRTIIRWPDEECNMLIDIWSKLREVILI